MSDVADPPVCLAVLNPRGRDPHLDYAAGIDGYRSGVHAPVNFHAFAAATRGAFFDSTRAVMAEKDRFDAVLVLIRRRAWISLAAVEQLQAAGCRVLVAWKECSHDQVARQLRSPRALAAYGRLIERADGILTPTLAWPPRCGAVSPETFEKKLKFLPTPYPTDHASWDFSVPFEERRGIMIGTREFRTESRHHVQAIARAATLAHEFDLARVTVVNTEGRKGLSLLRELAVAFPEDRLEVVERPLPYPEYMALLARRRFVYQMDRSNVPGQVAGDCLLARTLCVGGSSTIEKLAFPEFSDDGSVPMEQVSERMAEILRDEEAYREAIARSQRIAAERLSFASVARELGEWRVLQQVGGE